MEHQRVHQRRRGHPSHPQLVIQLIDQFFHTIDLTTDVKALYKAKALRRDLFARLPKRGMANGAASHKDYLDVYLDRPFACDPLMHIYSEAFIVNHRGYRLPILIRGAKQNYNWLFKMIQGDKMSTQAEFDYTMQMYEGELESIVNAVAAGAEPFYTNLSALLIRLAMSSEDGMGYLLGDTDELSYSGEKIRLDCSRQIGDYCTASRHKLFHEPDHVFMKRIADNVTALDVVIFNLTNMSETEQMIRYTTRVAKLSRSIRAKKVIIVSDYALNKDFEPTKSSYFIAQR